MGFDMYAANGTAEVAAVQDYAEACVFPSMDLAKQRLVVVPGAAQSTYSDARLF